MLWIRRWALLHYCTAALRSKHPYLDQSDSENIHTYVLICKITPELPYQVSHANATHYKKYVLLLSRFDSDEGTFDHAIGSRTTRE